MHKNSSIEPAEIEKFDRLSHKWQDKDGEFRMLHKINPLRLGFIEDKIKQHFNITENNSFENLDILDVGCGGGLISVPLSQKGANITAIDASPGNIDIANQNAKHQGLSINYLNMTLEGLCAHSKRYDIVVCLEVIEHVANVENFVANLSHILKPRGMLVISTINRNIKSYFLAILMAEYVLKWVPRNTHKHSKFLKPSELDMLLHKNELILRELKGLTFDPLSCDWKLSLNIDINYIAYAVKS